MIPPSELEAALALAFDEPGARPAFYKALLDSQVLTLVADPPKASGGWVRAALTSWLSNDGEHVVPIFTSSQALRESQLKETVIGVGSMLVLLEATRGHATHINPGSSITANFRWTTSCPCLSMGRSIMGSRRE
jgi:SseB protein N-terminal domain